MVQSPRIMNPRAMLLLIALFAAATASAADPSPAPREIRFSQTLTAAERAASGFDHLTSDEIAVIDALYRRDIAAQAAPRRPNAPAPAARFSQRLSLEERRNAGFASLSESELAQLDAVVDRVAPAAIGRAALLAAPTYVPLSVRARVVEARTAPEIHGSFTVGMGFGKGYSERFGGIELNYESPDKKLFISVSYSESHIKGSVPYYLARDSSSLGLGMGLGNFPRYEPEP